MNNSYISLLSVLHSNRVSLERVSFASHKILPAIAAATLHPTVLSSFFNAFHLANFIGKLANYISHFAISNSKMAFLFLHLAKTICQYENSNSKLANTISKIIYRNSKMKMINNNNEFVFSNNINFLLITN